MTEREVATHGLAYYETRRVLVMMYVNTSQRTLKKELTGVHALSKSRASTVTSWTLHRAWLSIPSQQRRARCKCPSGHLSYRHGLRCRRSMCNAIKERRAGRGRRSRAAVEQGRLGQDAGSTAAIYGSGEHSHNDVTRHGRRHNCAQFQTFKIVLCFVS